MSNLCHKELKMSTAAYQILAQNINGQVLRSCRGLDYKRAIDRAIDICKTYILHTASEGDIPEPSDEGLARVSRSYAISTLKKLRYMELL